MSRFPGMWGLFAILLCLQGLDFLTGGAAQRLLENRFVLTAGGQWGRLFTAQFIHLDWFHVILDVICIALLWAMLIPLCSQWRILVCFVVSGTVAQAFALGAWSLGLTQGTSLVGSSDALHGLIYLYLRQLYEDATNRRDRVWALSGVAMLLVSTLYTCATGTMIFAPMLKSPGYNHLGGILVFVLAVETGFLRPQSGSAHAKRR